MPLELMKVNNKIAVGSGEMGILGTWYGNLKERLTGICSLSHVMV